MQTLEFAGGEVVEAVHLEGSYQLRPTLQQSRPAQLVDRDVGVPETRVQLEEEAELALSEVH